MWVYYWCRSRPGSCSWYGLSGRSHEPKALFTFQKQRINGTLVRVSRERAYFRRSVFHHRGDDEASTLRTLSWRKRNAVPGTFNGRYHRTNCMRDISWIRYWRRGYLISDIPFLEIVAVLIIISYKNASQNVNILRGVYYAFLFYWIMRLLSSSLSSDYSERTYNTNRCC